MNKTFQSRQRSPRLASCVENSLAGFCRCQAETPHSQINQSKLELWLQSCNGRAWFLQLLVTPSCCCKWTNYCENQTWLPSIADGDALNALFKYMQASYCFCVGGHRQENTSAKSLEVPESLHKVSQQFVHLKLEQSEESKSIPKTEADNLLQVKAPARHQLDHGLSEIDEELEESSLNYKTRKDVVYKAAFRRMKKYFTQDFQVAFQDHFEQRDYLIRLQEYCSLKFPESNTSQACMMLDFIINPKNKLGVIPHVNRHLKRQVGKLMSCYSLKLFRQIEFRPEFLEILLHFLTIEGVGRMIFKDHRACFQSRVQTHLHQLKERAFWITNPMSG
ncbi:unnamed protein product [Moneuplotes crassus]|uniref:Uncharacterized protein n=1 Tax=Euplotes crassus TaxID=5936 RepID=A0AAD1XVH2_EUPCR|nr:unnamed protein product [Moneuplotes crassus]